MLRIKTADDDSVTTISKEDPAPYDSQGNGGIEVGVMILRGLFRTLKLCLEARLGKFTRSATQASLGCCNTRVYC